MAGRRRAGFYERRIFPWLNDKMTATPELLKLRAEALAAARGRVVEIGFGSGPNLAHYPGAVRSIVAIEPNVGMHERADPQLKASRFPVSMVVAEGERLPLRDGVFDTAVSVLTLCSVSDPMQVIRELSRVLRGDGRLIVVEHGLSDEPGVARWQNRLNAIQNIVACGCNLNQPIGGLVERGGFRFETLKRFYLGGAPRTHGCMSLGTASKV
jgi:ubiquinone/menaquinone biosynthesis C-methylase UbiE